MASFANTHVFHSLIMSLCRNVARPIRENLEVLLETRLPSPSTAPREELTTECAICYSYVIEEPGMPSLRRGHPKCHCHDIVVWFSLMSLLLAGQTGGQHTLIPDYVCANSRCNRSFHRRCVLEWLQALPSARVSFDTMFGSCPYCSSGIAIKQT